MKIANTKLKKTVIIVIGSIIITVIVIISLISPITKYLIEKYDEKYLGREIKIGFVYVNPFTGFIYLRNIKIYESNKDSIFFSAKGVSADFAMRKLLLNMIEISELSLNQPKGKIIQNKKNLNFDDLILKFTPKKHDKTPSNLHVNILNIKIKNGTFYYYEKVLPINYFIKGVDIESTGLYWNADTIAATFSFLSGTGKGNMKGDFMLNFKNFDYRLTTIINSFDLSIIEQYFNDFSNYGTFSANLDANFKVKGNFKDPENLNANGMLAITDFHMGKDPDDDYASFDKLAIYVSKLNPKGHQYLFDSLLLYHPFLKYERYDYLDNLQMMFGKNGSNISDAKQDYSRFNLILQIADYIKILAKNFFRSNYKINTLAIYKGVFKYNDYSLSEKFSIESNPLSVFADSVNKNQKRVEVFLKSGIHPFGNVLVHLSINPKDSGDFDMHYQIQKLPVTIFNPYLITYTSYPLDRGTIELNGAWKVRNGIIKSDNHLQLIDTRVTKQQRNKSQKWIPLPLIMFFIRENGNVIDYEIPITGNLKNPQFHLYDVFYDIFRNIFVKPPATPYRTQIKKIENEIENSFALKWKMRQSSLLPNQEMFVNRLANFLKKNPEASVSIYPMQFEEKEKEYITFFEAKKKYFFVSNNINDQFLSEDDSLKVEKISVKDSFFVQYLNKQVNDPMLFTIQDKCNKLLGTAYVNIRFNQLNKERKDVFKVYFKNKGVDNKIKIYTGENIIPFNGFSFYKINYKGEIPESIMKAYQKMNELNNITPRNKYKKIRGDSRSVIKEIK